MKPIKPLVCALSVCIIVMIGCQKEANSPSSLNAAKNQGNASTNTIVLKAKLEKMLASLPAGHQDRLRENEKRFLKQHPEYRALVLKALSPSPCDANTNFSVWINQELADWTDEIFIYAILTGMVDFPTYDALLFENSSANQYFGVKGEHTHTITKTFKDLNRFWDIQAKTIIPVGMHGAMLRNREKLIRIDKVLFGDSQEVAEFWADFILTLLDVFPQFRNGDHPIFSFNAYAQPSFSFPPFGIIPDKIVMGDGIMAGFTGIGFNDVAPQAIFAHEFGHHIQFQLGLITDDNSPEATRRTELMADAFSAYYLAHSKGASMQWKRVKQFLQVFYNIGDCAFDENNHHGTPRQRMAAADWAYSVVTNASNQGHQLTSLQFATLFDAQLPVLVSQ